MWDPAESQPSAGEEFPAVARFPAHRSTRARTPTFRATPGSRVVCPRNSPENEAGVYSVRSRRGVLLRVGAQALLHRLWDAAEASGAQRGVSDAAVISPPVEQRGARDAAAEAARGTCGKNPRRSGMQVPLARSFPILTEGPAVLVAAAEAAGNQAPAPAE